MFFFEKVSSKAIHTIKNVQKQFANEYIPIINSCNQIVKKYSIDSDLIYQESLWSLYSPMQVPLIHFFFLELGIITQLVAVV